MLVFLVPEPRDEPTSCYVEMCSIRGIQIDVIWRMEDEPAEFCAASDRVGQLRPYLATQTSS